MCLITNCRKYMHVIETHRLFWHFIVQKKKRKTKLKCPCGIARVGEGTARIEREMWKVSEEEGIDCVLFKAKQKKEETNKKKCIRTLDIFSGMPGLNCQSEIANQFCKRPHPPPPPHRHFQPN